MRKALKMSLLLGTIVVLLALTACGVDGDYNSNDAPTISITSWEGAENEVAADTLDILVFQQRIYWNTNDNDGTISGIAYRILDINGNPIATPGNSVIDNLGEIESINYEGEELVGWVVHYKQGADENIPLTSNEAKKTIWSQSQYAVVNFPANENGEPSEMISSFEVICIDNRGTISNLAKKSFKTASSIPNCILSTSRGNPYGKEVGTGLYLTISMSTEPGDPLAVSGADYYEYKVGKYVYDPEYDYNADPDSTITPILIEETDWLVTEDSQIILTKNSNPALIPDFAGTEADAEQLTFTRISAHAYNYAGVKSKESYIQFAVKEGFHPKTMLYPEKIYALGNYHYKDYTETEDQETYPYIMQDGTVPVIYATSFFIDKDGMKTAVNSPNLKVYAKWGYYGQYGTPPTASAGAITYTDSPYDTEVGRVLNESDDDSHNYTDADDYYSEIVAYDIRFDDAPFNFYALSQDPENIVTHDDGTQWLRVPKNSVWSISKGLDMGNLSNGIHKLEVCAVDLQFEPDPTPEVLEFKLLEFIPKEERERVMVLDASVFGVTQGDYMAAYTDSVYNSIFSSYPNVDLYERTAMQANSGLSPDAYFIAYSDLLQYKTLIYREESNSLTNYFSNDHDALKLFVHNGGNIILSASKNLKSINDQFVNNNKNLFSRYFGIGLNLNSVIAFPSARKYTNGAIPTDESIAYGNLPNLDLNLSEPYSYTINFFNALAEMAYFSEDFANPEDNFTKILYRSKIKNVGDDNYSPQTEEIYNEYNALPVIVGKTTLQNKCIVTGFPLSFMQQAELAQLFEELLND